MKRSGHYNPDPRRRSRTRSRSKESLESFFQEKRSLPLSSSMMRDSSKKGSKKNIWINNRVQSKYNSKYRSNPKKKHNKINFHCDRSNNDSDNNTDFVTCDLSLTKPSYPYTPWIRINASDDKECSNTLSDNAQWIKLVNEFLGGLRPGKDESTPVLKEQRNTDGIAVKQEVSEMGAKYFANGMSLHEEFKSKVSSQSHQHKYFIILITCSFGWLYGFSKAIDTQIMGICLQISLNCHMNNKMGYKDKHVKIYRTYRQTSDKNSF